MANTIAFSTIFLLTILPTLIRLAPAANCSTNLPHKPEFCIICNSSFLEEDGTCVSQCSSGYTQFVDSANNKRCIKTFAQSCTSPCLTCLTSTPTHCLSCVSGKFLKGITCVDAVDCTSNGLIPEQGFCKGNRREDEHICQPGTYNDLSGQSSSSACKTCPAGKFCGGYKAQAAVNCDAGYYCSAGAKYAKNHNQVNGINTSNATGGRCPIGSFCPSESSSARACGPGKYCERQGLGSQSGNCQAGFECITGSTTPTPDGTSPSNGRVCPQGYYCAAGAVAVACPRGTYMPYTGATAQKECIPCDPGKYCNSTGRTAVNGDCDKGYFCSGGSDSQTPSSGICPKGYKCSAGSASPTPCPLSEYQDQEGKENCKACLEGNYCTATSTLTCPAGYYCLANNIKIPCPPGTYRSLTGGKILNDCSDCLPGYACPNHATVDSTLNKCQQGYYCTGKATTNMPKQPSQGGGLCQKKYFCPLGSQKQISCSAGKYCPTQGLATPAGDCQPGFFCSGGSQTSIPRGTGGDICPTGRYCPAGSSAALQCPDKNNQYINYQGADKSGDCLPCPAGQTCADGKLSSSCPVGKYCDHSGAQIDCEQGYKCPAGSRDKIPCQPGYYQSQKAMGVCLQCTVGNYCQGLKTVTPTPCPDGYYCPVGTAARNTYPCPIGKRGKGTGQQNQGTGCQPCDSGKYCPTQGLVQTGLPSCNAGYFCNAGAKVSRPYQSTDCLSSSDCGPCPAGKYCLQSSPAGTNCPHGTYMPYTGARSSDDCLPVPPGIYSTGTGLTALPSIFTQNVYDQCDQGYLCFGGSYNRAPTTSSIGQKCQAGYYCPKGATYQLKCQVATYNPTPGQGSCLACPAGQYCPKQGLSAGTTCPPGYFCTAGSRQPKPCPRGKFSSASGNDQQNDCQDCPAGKYCETEGLASADNDCQAGYVCVGASKTARPQSEAYSDSNKINGLCPKGSFCSRGTSIPQICTSGKYNPSLGQGQCFDCAPGYFCSGSGLQTLGPAQQCSAGFVCRKGSTTNSPTSVVGYACPATNFCEAGSAQQIKCLDGQYQPGTQQPSCLPCPAGSLCKASVQTDCVARKFCPQGSSYGQLCLNGRQNEKSVATNLQTNDECAECASTKFCMGGLQIGDCQAGYYCQRGADSPTPNIADASPCPENHYCQQGEDNPNKCPSQKYTQGKGHIQESDCVDCPNGYYCQNDTSVQCPKGAYCPNGVASPSLCPSTTYNDQTQQYSPSHCKPCPAGYFCSISGVGDLDQKDSDGNFKHKCSPGHYCLQKASFQIPCPAGTYRLADLGTDFTKCLSCPSGYYCTRGIAMPVLCKDDEYCNGSSRPQPCPGGKECKIVDLVGDPYFSKQMLFTDCPQNYYCKQGNEGGQRKKACAPGKFCPPGSKYQQICDINPTTGRCTQCPAGQYSSGVTQCKKCAKGYVCIGGTNTKYPSDRATQFGYPCPKGHYCPQGSSVQTPCPVGTYNPSIRGSSINQCLPCQNGTYNDITGQKSCLSCGPAATNNSKRTSCTCNGQFRAFQKHDTSCKCIPGYTYQVQPGSSSSDNCQPIQLPVDCNYNHLGVCGVDCFTECGGSTDAYQTDQGICACKAPSTEQVCMKNCQDNFLSITLTASLQIQISHPNNSQKTSPIDFSSLTNVFGQPQCSLSCKIVSVVNGITSYEPSNFFINLFKSQFSSYSSNVRNLREVTLVNKQSSPRNLQASQTTFQSPVVCIAPQTTIAFDTSSGSYPVYQKDSLLNTNQKFDYSQFEILGSRIKLASATISTFFFTFTVQGVYAFADSNNSANKQIIRVASQGQCSENYLMELSNLALVTNEITKDTARIVEYTPYWPVAVLLTFVVIILISISMLVAYFLKIDRFDIELQKDRAGVQDSKANSDQRLKAVKRKLKELIKQVQLAKNKKAPDDDWSEQNVGKLDNFQLEIQLLIQSLGLKEPQDEIFQQDSISSRLSDYSLNGGGGSNKSNNMIGFPQIQQDDKQIQKEGSDYSIGGSAQAIDGGDQKNDLGDGLLLSKKGIPKKHSGFIDQRALRNTIDARKVDFETELRKYNFDSDDKREQIKQYETGMAAIQRQLQEEKNKQQMHLMNELKKRRKNVQKQEDKLSDVLNREKAIKQRHKSEIQEITKSITEKEKEVDKVYDQELRKIKRDQIREKNQSLKEFKKQFHDKIKKHSDPAEIRYLQEQHELAYNNFVETLDKELAEQNKGKYERLAQRKQKRLAQVRSTFQKNLNMHISRQQKELMTQVLEEKMRLQAEHRIFRDQDLPQLQGADKEREEKLKQQYELERQIALDQLKNEHSADKNLIEIEHRNIEQEMITAAQTGDLPLPAEQELQNKREMFKEKLASASSDNERRKLIREKELEEQRLLEQIKREKKMQGEMLNRRRLELEHRKQLKMLKLQREQDLEKKNKQLSMLEKQDLANEEEELKKIDQIVKKGVESGQINYQELPLVIDNFLAQHHTKQLKNLLNRQFLQISKNLTDLLSHISNEKMNEIKYTKDLFAQKFRQLEKAGLPAKKFAQEAQKLQRMKEQELKNIEAKSKLQQMDEQGQMRANLAKKHADQKIRLKQAQMREKQQILQKIVNLYANENGQNGAKLDKNQKDFIRMINNELMKNTGQELREYNKTVNNERKQTMEDIKKRLFFDNSEQMERFQKNFEEEMNLQKVRINTKLKKEKEDLKLRRKQSFDQRLKRMEGMAQANIDVYIAEYEENMRRLDSAMEAQRQKQLNNIYDKMKLRKMKQQKAKNLKEQAKSIISSLIQRNFGDRLVGQDEELRAKSTNQSDMMKKLSQAGQKQQQSSILQEKEKVGLKKAQINYKVKLKQWAQFVKTNPPQLALGSGRERTGSVVDFQELRSSLGDTFRSSFGNEDNRMRSLSVFSRGSRLEKDEEDELLERVLKIERMAKMLLQ